MERGGKRISFKEYLRDANDGIYTGSTDIGSVTVRDRIGVQSISLGCDGMFKVKTVDKPPEKARYIGSFIDWLWIYDDTERIAAVRGNTSVYGIENYKGGTDLFIVKE